MNAEWVFRSYLVRACAISAAPLMDHFVQTLMWQYAQDPDFGAINCLTKPPDKCVWFRRQEPPPSQVCMVVAHNMTRFAQLLATLCIVAVCFTVQLQGACLRNVPVTVVQPNGETLHLLATGDEFHNWLHDHDQYTINQDDTTGYYTYAMRAKNGLAPSPYIVGQADPRQVGLEKGINLSPCTLFLSSVSISIQQILFERHSTISCSRGFPDTVSC